MVKIAMVSDCESYGGAAIAASRLAASFVSEGVQILRIVARASHRGDDVLSIRGLRMPTRWSSAQISWLGRSLWSGQVERAFARVLDGFQPDYISVHNLHNATASGWSARLVSMCADRAPTIWTLHDMWSFTGRCAHNGDCLRFVNGCDEACPTAGEYPAFPRSRIHDEWLSRRRMILDHHQLFAVTPSEWLARRATEGLWPKERVRVIPNGLDLTVYRPEERSVARSSIGIRSQGTVAMVVLPDFRDVKKGGDLVATAMRECAHREVLCVTIGRHPTAIDWSGVETRHLGWVDDERRKALAYSAADLVIHASRAENLPNVAVESIACGTPVAAFDVGGTSEVVRPGETGWLARTISAKALATVLDEAFATVGRQELRAKCREHAMRHYDAATMCRCYLNLFESIPARVANADRLSVAER